jgi:hypothetical protein
MRVCPQCKEHAIVGENRAPYRGPSGRQNVVIFESLWGQFALHGTKHQTGSESVVVKI